MSKKFGIIVTVIALIAVCMSAVTLVLTLQPKSADAQDKKDAQYVMYLGTNDKDTNEPVFNAEQARAKAEDILIKHFGGYTIQDAHGGWESDGKRYQEYTIVIHLSDTTLDKVHAAADEMLGTFRQSSVLIQENETKTEFYSGTEQK